MPHTVDVNLSAPFVVLLEYGHMYLPWVLSLGPVKRFPHLRFEVIYIMLLIHLLQVDLHVQIVDYNEPRGDGDLLDDHLRQLVNQVELRMHIQVL